MVTILLGALGLFGVWYLVQFFRTLKEEEWSFDRFGHLTVVGFVTNFFDTLGIGSFAPTTTWFRTASLVKDRIIPGTLNVGHTAPVIIMAFIFIGSVEVEPVTLFSMLGAAVLGSYFGADIVSSFSEKKIQLGMGIALLVTAVFMLLGQVDLMPAGGEALGLSGISLVIAVVANFVLGALMTLGIGLYAPCMALVYALGLSPRVAFPIMMGSCAFLMPPASVKFLKNKAVDYKAALGLALGGIPAVFVATYLVVSLPLNVLTWLVIGVITFTGFSLFKDGLANTGRKKEVETEAA